MRKVLLLSLATMLAAPTFAQDQIGDDCTKYIVNPGFDEDLTWQADGSTKEIVDKSTNLSNRGQRWLAADGTGYAWGGISANKRADGLIGWNGFFGQIKGWTAANGNNNSVAEWTYFGSVPYAIGATAVPIADNGTGYLEAPPTKPDEAQGDDNVGFLYLRAGWGGKATYTQNVHVPVGKYTLSYWVYNTNYENSKNNTAVKNLSQVVCRRDTVVDTDGFNAQTWTKHTIDITATDSLTITFGFQSDGGSVKNPYVCIDDIRLVKYDNVTREEVLASDIDELLAEMDVCETDLQDYQGITTEIEDAKIELYDAQDAADLETLEAAYTKGAADLARFQAAQETINKVTALEEKANKLRESAYPGLEALDAAINAAEDSITNGTTTAIIAQIDALDAAIKTYLASKEATEADPSDFTYYTQNPWFIKDGLEPTLNADGSCTYPNATKADGTANYSAGSSNDDFTSTGWYKGTKYTSGDQRLNFAQGRSCWNAWGTNFSEVSINQDLKDLPNGYYTVSADLITQANYVTDQHVFAKSALEESNSEALTSGNWSDNNDGAWTTLTTGKVLVHDGKLTIGAAGTGANGDQSGWFCATNFKLSFVGKATDEEIAAAIAKKTATADALVASMHYAADKASVQDSIDTYKTTGDLAVLNNGIALGNTSEAKYTEVMAEGKTIPTVSAAIADENSYAPVHDIAAFAWEKTNAYLTSSEATYTAIDTKIAELKRYVNTYYTAAHNVDSVSNSLKSTSAKEALAATLAEQKSVLTNGDSIQSEAIVTALVAQLNAAIAKAQAQEAYEKNPDATDYTGNIQNPDAAAEDGWNIDKGVGNTNTASGQYYDQSVGNTTHRYFDSWASSGLNYYADQKVVGLPNGTYEVSVYTRTSGTGAYVFSANGTEATDTTWMEIPVQTFNYTHNDQGIGGDTAADGGDSIVTATDKFGQVWADAVLAYKADNTRSDLAGITTANNGQGYGWQLQTWKAEVNNHELTIGMTTDSLRTGKDAFTGTWFSVVDWGLKLLAAGDNTGWSGPITGVAEIKTNATVMTDAIYTINGQRVAKMSKPGLYIVVENGKAKKVMMK